MALALGGCPLEDSPYGAPCADDGDCAQGYRCRQELCVPASFPAVDAGLGSIRFDLTHPNIKMTDNGVVYGFSGINAQDPNNINYDPVNKILTIGKVAPRLTTSDLEIHAEDGSTKARQFVYSDASGYLGGFQGFREVDGKFPFRIRYCQCHRIVINITQFTQFLKP